MIERTDGSVKTKGVMSEMDQYLSMGVWSDIDEVNLSWHWSRSWKGWCRGHEPMSTMRCFGIVNVDWAYVPAARSGPEGYVHRVCTKLSYKYFLAGLIFTYVALRGFLLGYTGWSGNNTERGQTFLTDRGCARHSWNLTSVLLIVLRYNDLSMGFGWKQLHRQFSLPPPDRSVSTTVNLT